MSQSGTPNTTSKPATSRLELFLLILIPFGGMALAAWMYFAGDLLPEGRNHKGHLLTPSLTLEDFHSPELSPEALDGKWGIIVVDGSDRCGQPCIDVLHLTRQTHIALNRNAGRVSRYYLSGTMSSNAKDQLEALIEKEHEGLQSMSGSMPVLPYGADESIRVFVTDPLGNVMLWYGKEHTGKQMLKDLEKLLKASRIG